MRIHASIATSVPALPETTQHDIVRLESHVRRLATRWLHVAYAVVPAPVRASGAFVPLAGAQQPLAGRNAGIHIGVEDGKPAFRFSLGMQPATAAEVLRTAPPGTLRRWLGSVTYLTEVRARGAARSLRLPRPAL